MLHAKDCHHHQSGRRRWGCRMASKDREGGALVAKQEDSLADNIEYKTIKLEKKKMKVELGKITQGYTLYFWKRLERIYHMTPDRTTNTIHYSRYRHFTPRQPEMSDVSQT